MFSRRKPEAQVTLLIYNRAGIKRLSLFFLTSSSTEAGSLQRQGTEKHDIVGPGKKGRQCQWERLKEKRLTTRADRWDIFSAHEMVFYREDASCSLRACWGLRYFPAVLQSLSLKRNPAVDHSSAAMKEEGERAGQTGISGSELCTDHGALEMTTG